MRLVDAAEPTFARHETFHPRYGWFRKAYAFSALDPHVFSREDAPVIIGVGKNMVRAIKFWGLAAKVIVEKPDPTLRRAPGIVPTNIGDRLFGPHGWDRFMEDPGTLWLLHWLLLAPPSKLPVWWIAFNEFHAVEFSESDLALTVDAQLDAASGWTMPHPSSVRKDLGALFRTYAPITATGRAGIDDLLDCPLRELGLIGRSAARSSCYRFSLGPKVTLPSAIVTYAVLDYIARSEITGNTITIGRLASEASAPGRAFKLSEADLISSLQATIDASDGLQLVTPTGAHQLSWSRSPERIAGQVLEFYYGGSGADFIGGPEGDRPAIDSPNALPASGLEFSTEESPTTSIPSAETH